MRPDCSMISEIIALSIRPPLRTKMVVDAMLQHSAKLLHFWAKLGNEIWPNSYHPVLCHLIDVAAVASALWEGVFRSRFRAWFAQRLQLDQVSCKRWLAFWSAAHDIGKVSPCFQDRGTKNTAALPTRLGNDWFTATRGNEAHGVLSTTILAHELKVKWPAVDKSVARNIAIAVGGHHGIFPTNWDGICGPLGNERWAAARSELLAELARLLGVRDLAPPRAIAPDDHSIWMCLAGITSVADWIGSNQEFFKPVGTPAFLEDAFDADEYFRMAERAAEKALEELGWLGRLDVDTPVTFGELFPFIHEPRPLQTAIVEMANNLTEPTLVIVEAPMGEGKTEAAWYTAACWDRRGGQGTYVALPTMATSNQMYERVEAFLQRNEGRSNVQLLHGKAQLNERFSERLRLTEIYDHVGQQHNKEQASVVVAESWFAANKKHGLLAPYGVGTIDQALLAVLQTKHVFVRLFGLAGKCVILDEVHAYDTYMTTLMERLLRWLAALGCPVVLLSATLPKEKRLALLRAYAGDAVADPKEQPYPRLTSVKGGGTVTLIHVPPDEARSKNLKLAWIKKDQLGAKLKRALAAGGCAAVIRNAVGLAQQTFLELRDALRAELESGELELYLFHARFPFGRREEIEDNVLKWFGRTEEDKIENGRIVEAPHRPKKAVLVATQVIEQSLDLDFDLMISDVAPVDLVLQRAGRLHRHNRDQRPHGVVEAHLWLIKPDLQDGAPAFGVSGLIYSDYILFRSFLSLRHNGSALRESVTLPGHIDELVTAVYTGDQAPENLSTQELRFWNQSRAAHQEAIARERDEAEGRRIKKPVFRGDLARIIGEPREEDNPHLHPAHQALTRLTRPTAQLIILSRDRLGLLSMLHDGNALPSIAVPKTTEGRIAQTKRLLLGELTTAHPGVVRQLWQRPRRPDEWCEVGLLREHHLVVFADGNAQVGPYTLAVDNELGLTITREDRLGEDE